ncbi:hypothetical protein M885DRAFT_497164 [Pelagophyceae sp. CCMP2097]|nr:hypothetical protein M885DRAFT_497164 [Pelagophyceae sp. CCMP2097]
MGLLRPLASRAEEVALLRSQLGVYGAVEAALDALPRGTAASNFWSAHGDVLRRAPLLRADLDTLGVVRFSDEADEGAMTPATRQSVRRVKSAAQVDGDLLLAHVFAKHVLCDLDDHWLAGFKRAAVPRQTREMWTAVIHGYEPKRFSFGVSDGPALAADAASTVPRSVDGDASTAAPPSRGAKRPSETADGAAVAKSARRGTAHSSKFYGVWWHKRDYKWRAGFRDAAGRAVHVGCFDVEEDAARAYNAAVIQANLANIKVNLEKDGVLLEEKPIMSSEFHGVNFNCDKNRWQASIKRGKRHGLDGKKQHLGYHEDEQDAALAVDSFTRLHMPGMALNFPTLDELYVSKLEVPLQVLLTYDIGGGGREFIAAQLTKVKYDPSHESVWRYLMEFEDAPSAELLGLEASFWDPASTIRAMIAAFASKSAGALRRHVATLSAATTRRARGDAAGGGAGHVRAVMDQ